MKRRAVLGTSRISHCSFKENGNHRTTCNNTFQPQVAPGDWNQTTLNIHAHDHLQDTPAVSTTIPPAQNIDTKFFPQLLLHEGEEWPPWKPPLFSLDFGARVTYLNRCWYIEIFIIKQPSPILSSFVFINHYMVYMYMYCLDDKMSLKY